MSNDAISDLQLALRDAEATLAFSEQVLALTTSELFQNVVLKAYVQEGTKTLMGQRATLTDLDKLSEVQRRLDAIALFSHWFGTKLHAGQEAEDRVSEIKAELNAVYNEEDEA